MSKMAELAAELEEMNGPDGCDEPVQDDDRDEGPPLCGCCAGSGEGMYDGSTCGVCRGSGEVRPKSDREEARADFLYDQRKDEPRGYADGFIDDDLPF